jgi:hypothetical protein
MYITIKRDLTQHLQTLDHYFMCFDLSILDWDDIQMRQLKSLSQSIRCLRFIIEGFAMEHMPLPSVIENDVCNQIVTIADLAQLLLHRCADDLSEDSTTHLQKFISTLKTVYDDVNAYATRVSA